MTPLSARILAAAALAFEPIPIVELSPEEFSEREGIALENARLLPLLTALAGVASAAEALDGKPATCRALNEKLAALESALRLEIAKEGT